MPNHVLNVVTFSHSLDEIREFVKGDLDADGDQRIFDFNKIVPMPDDVYASMDERSSGIPLWYDWSVANWGTKWNAYEVCSIYEQGYSFWTAWSAPEQIFVALSERFPDVTITVEFADEDTGGGNCGRFVLEQGAVQTFEQGDYQFACQLWGYEPVEEEIEDEL